MARTSGSHALKTGPKVRLAALKLFALYGYAAVSMRQIAAEVGVQVGALYNYTPDKQSLLYDLMHTHLTDLLQTWRSQKTDTAPEELVLQFVTFHLNYHLDKSEAVFIAYMELRNLSELNFAKIETLRKSYELELESIITAGQRACIFSVEDPKITSFAILGMLKEVGTWFDGEGRLAKDEIIALYRDLVLRMLGVPASKP
jgi:AcrR family transcriptional regulator